MTFGGLPTPEGIGTINGETTTNKTDAWIAAISCSIAVSVIALVCIVLIGRRGLSDTVQLYFVGLGAGSMLGTLSRLWHHFGFPELMVCLQARQP